MEDVAQMPLLHYAFLSNLNLYSCDATQAATIVAKTEHHDLLVGNPGFNIVTMNSN
jgi:hypothetical protein